MEDGSFLTAYHGNDDIQDDVSVTRRTRSKCECKASLVGAIIAIVVSAAVVAAVVIAVPLIFSVTYRSSSMSSQTSTTCLSAEYIKLSASVLAALDQTVDPCTSFYEFSCGNWVQNTTIPPGEFLS